MVTIFEAVLSVAFIGAVILVNRLLPSVTSQETVNRNHNVPGALPNVVEKRKKKKRAKDQPQSLSRNVSSNNEKDEFNMTDTSTAATSTLLSHGAESKTSSNGATDIRSIAKASAISPSVIASKTLKAPVQNEKVDFNTEKATSSSRPHLSDPAASEAMVGDISDVLAARDAESDYVSEPSTPESARSVHATGVRVLRIVGSSDKKATKISKSLTASAELTKKQRQNKKKYEAIKETKLMQQEEQERRLREFKQQKAREAILEQQQKLDAQKIKLASLLKQDPVMPAKQKPNLPPVPAAASKNEVNPSFNTVRYAVEEQSWESVPTRKGPKGNKNTSRSVDDVPDIPDSRFSLP
ncbi:uncharacterized protein V1513DRAFT_444280 [Lipomyces chichibuensis]|uniref:uncharacterized protein n=1 Tax=Lipomyces chichibuensis TaxID=1546026 RepID=UPI003343B9BA